MRFSVPDPRARSVLGACAAAGGLGCLSGAGGAFDPVTLLGWLALVAPAAGVLCGARGVAWFPFALAVPGSWSLLLVLAEARGGNGRWTLLWAICALVGLFGLGFAAGRRTRFPLRGAGLALLGTLGLSGAALGFGLLVDGSGLARADPWLAARLLELSPLVLVFDCAGHDWVHAQPEVYAGAGIEWFQRRPYAGTLWGPLWLLVGSALAAFSRPRRLEP